MNCCSAWKMCKKLEITSWPALLVERQHAEWFESHVGWKKVLSIMAASYIVYNSFCISKLNFLGIIHVIKLVRGLVLMSHPLSLCAPWLPPLSSQMGGKLKESNWNQKMRRGRLSPKHPPMPPALEHYQLYNLCPVVKTCEHRQKTQAIPNWQAGSNLSGED